MLKSCLAAIALAILATHAWANPRAASYFDDKERGWFWYEPIPDPPAKNKAKESAARAPAVLDDPQAALKAYQKKLEDARALAVMAPTQENVRAYMQLQHETMERAGTFADAWRRVVWSSPELDTTLRNPVSQVAMETQRKIKRLDRNQAIGMVAKTDGLFFFFKESCPYCHTQAPILRNFAARYGVSVVPISMDGGMLPDFPNARPDVGWAQELGVTATPALFMVNPRTRQVVPLGFGVLTEEDIADRIHIIAMRRLGEI